MKKINCLIFISLIIQSSTAQNSRFVTEGRIEFERKINLHSQISGDGLWQDEYKKALPKFQTNYFNLLFSNNKTLYKPGREVAENNKINNWWALPAQDNIIYTDLDKQQSISEKNLFEKIFFNN